MTRIKAAICAAVLAALALGAGATHTANAATSGVKTYVVVFDGNDTSGGTYAVESDYAVESTYAVLCSYAVGNTYAVTGQYAVGCNYAVTGAYAVYAVAQKYAVSLVQTAGGTVVGDLLKQTGTMIVRSANQNFAQAMSAYAVVDQVVLDYAWKAQPTLAEAVENGALDSVSPASVPGGGPESTDDPLESLQWSMDNIDTKEAHAIQAGSRSVEVGILDSGIDGRHADFVADLAGPNVDCLKGRDFVGIGGPGIGNPDPCTDNQFHGTHVAGIVAAQANGLGVVGVAPNVTLVPVKVCDTSGYCYSSSTVAGITYAGDAKLEVINMSFFVDDDELQESTEFKCMTDEQQAGFRVANERAIAYARKQGVTPVAALGNSDNDLAAPPDPYNNKCDVVPAETKGVIGVAALGPENEKAYYSSYGAGANDVAAPGGNPEFLEETCVDEVLSTIPGQLYGCFSGTSMASPHAAGVAALIVSQFGKVGSDGDIQLPSDKVEQYLESSAIDQGLPGYDECFGNGRINALRAVTHATTKLYDATAPFCPEYGE